MSLVGRDDEQRRIETLLTRACDEHSGALVLRGEAGIGKSVLLNHAVSVAESRGMRVIRAIGVESDSELAYSGLHQLLFTHVDRLAALSGPQANAIRGAFGLDRADASRFLIAAGTLALLAEIADDAPLLCVVDDLQWFDQGSVEALLFAARRFEADPIAMLFAVRETSLPFETPGLDVAHLSGLAVPAAATLLASHAPGLADPLRARVLAESAGNPLAVIELSREADDVGLIGPVGTLPVPRRVQAAFRRQIGELPTSTRRALLVAAADSAAPLPTILSVIEAVGGAAADLAAAERATLVRIGSGIEFRHPLVRAAAYGGEPLHERIDVHRAYANALTADVDADRRAWHLAAATTSPDEAVTAELERAAERARHRGGAMAMSIAYDRAARLSVDGEHKARRIALAAQAAFDAGKPDRAARLAAEALSLTTDPGVRADAIYAQGAVAYERTSPRTDAELTIEAAALVRESDPERAALNLYEAMHAARHCAEPDLLERAALLLRDVTPPEQWEPVVDALIAWADLFAGRPESAVGPMRELHESVRRGDLDLMHRMTAALGGLMIGDENDAIRTAEDMLTHVRASGALGWVPYVLDALALARLLRGEFAQARTCVVEGTAVSDEFGNATESLAHRSVEIWLLAVSGEEDRCRELAAEVLPRARNRHRVNAEIGLWGLAVLDLAAKRYDVALEGLEQVCSGPARRDVLMRAVPDLVEAAVRSDAPDRARNALAEFEYWAEQVDRPVPTGLALRCRALLADDDEPYREAVQLHDSYAGPYDRARTRLVYGEWLRRRRRRTEARAHLEAAAADFDLLGARLWADRAYGELAAFGGPRVAQQRRGPLTLLTPQELQVVQLAAAGQTNKEIAAQLYLSPRTVGHHLYKAYPKLGVTARSELSDLLGASRPRSDTSHDD